MRVWKAKVRIVRIAPKAPRNLYGNQLMFLICVVISKERAGSYLKGRDTSSPREPIGPLLL
jgi:hypothetical protein